MSLNFPLLLVIAVFVCGLLGLIDLLFLAPRRRAAIANYQVAVLKETLRLASAVAVDPELDEVFRRWQAAATTETARWAQIATNSAAEQRIEAIEARITLHASAATATQP